MARSMSGCSTAQPQQGGEKEPETNPTVPQQEGQPHATEGKVIADYNLDEDYKSEGSDPEIKPVEEVEKKSAE